MSDLDGYNPMQQNSSISEPYWDATVAKIVQVLQGWMRFAHRESEKDRRTLEEKQVLGGNEETSVGLFALEMTAVPTSAKSIPKPG